MDQAKANETQDPVEVDRIIAEELEKLLDSPLFTRSPVLSRLLQFLVEHRLRGGRSSPKAYAIATEALGRSEDFDPAVDSYPRVMVGRLRGLLDRYYADTPWVHRLRVPQGSYEVVVQYRSAPPSSRSADGAEDEDDVKAATLRPAAAHSPTSGRVSRARGSRFGRWIVVLILLAVALFTLWTLREGSGRLFAGDPVPVPLLEVSPPMAGNLPQSRALARALDGKLRDGLRRFDLIDLLSSKAPGGAAARTGDYRLDTSLVRTVEGDTDVTLVLNRVADQRAIWSQQMRLTSDETPEFTAIEPLIAQLAGDYGVIVRDQVQRQPDNFAAGFPCLAQFNRMRQMRSAASAKRVDACLRATIEATPRDPVALTALSLVRYGDWQPQRLTPAGREALGEARALALRSYESSPNSTAGLFAMARANFYSGNCAGGNAMGDAAIALNPFDADMSGFLGLFKLACGQAGEGEVLLRRSLQLDASYPGVPAVTLAFVLSQRGELEEAQRILDHMPSPSNMEPQYMMARAVVLARRGNLAEARAQWRQLLAYTRQPADASPETVLGHFMITPAVIQAASAALRDSGVVVAKTAP
ncbi:tetratricopeptide repeat protein [Sphingopyxis sp. PAMC25046]|uniref:tetratricopeptide repeat protein n=1 Tax=Sphingopyxis sp. PAMC25046 TaxID=2565556 RepID=UPI00109E02F6|nr:tetratricopeptide repeat protein [Sphingopyxis sp. PAMC25046]QCB55903.1 tetratricopeptide repeat protein [Sphingopyxis sp. PAMC25046]